MTCQLLIKYVCTRTSLLIWLTLILVACPHYFLWPIIQKVLTENRLPNRHFMPRYRLKPEKWGQRVNSIYLNLLIFVHVRYSHLPPPPPSHRCVWQSESGKIGAVHAITWRGGFKGLVEPDKSMYKTFHPFPFDNHKIHLKETEIQLHELQPKSCNYTDDKR